MRRVVALVLLVVTGVATGMVLTGSSPAIGGTTYTTIRLDGVSVQLPAGSRQVVTVEASSGYHARVTLWAHTSDGWVRREWTRDGRIGYGGLVDGTQRVQGTGTTPLGTYRLLWSFGTTAPRATWDLFHHRILAHDYWVQDNRSAYYNRLRNRSRGGFRWWLPASDVNGSERLAAFPVQYEMSIVTSYNYSEQVRHRGSGIFLHVNGPGATAGCVSVPRLMMSHIMASLEPGRLPVIAIGR